ncbi:MAG: cation:proton antiporter [Ignavibacteria bacterium]|nr:cation:proton antiporter [Ignavibacteria bacterium]
MHEGGFFYQAFLYLVTAVVTVPIAKKLGLGSVLGYLIGGIIIGPALLGLVGNEGQDIMHFAEFGVVMMLFVIGLELEPSLLWRLRASILGMGGLQIGLTALVAGGAAFAFGLSWQASLAIGFTLSLSSTAIVMQTLQEKGLIKSGAGQSSFSVLLFQDIAVIPILAIFPLLATTNTTAPVNAHPSFMETLPAWLQTLFVIGAVGVIVLAGKYLLNHVFRIVAKTAMREIFTAMVLLLVIGIALLMNFVGLSPALGAFVAGVVLANSEYRHELESDIDPFKGLLLGLFFISVGASINFDLVTDQPVTILLLTLGLMFIKAAVVFVIGKIFRLGNGESSIFAVALAQVGEFAFVLFSFSSSLGILDSNTTGILTAVVAISMALTPFIFTFNEKVILPLLARSNPAPEREEDKIEEKGKVIIAGFGRFGNTAGRFLRANGVFPTVIDNDSDRVETLRKLGIKVYYGEPTRHDLLHAAGAEEAKIIIIALDIPEKVLEMVHTVKKHFPHAKILARAYDRADAYDLMDAGVDKVYRETLDTSLRMGADTLKHLGYRAYQTERMSHIFFNHDEENLKELAAHRKDKSEYLSAARQAIEELEEIIREDFKDTDVSRDAGWDSESLREEFGKF